MLEAFQPAAVGVLALGFPMYSVSLFSLRPTSAMTSLACACWSGFRYWFPSPRQDPAGPCAGPRLRLTRSAPSAHMVSPGSEEPGHLAPVVLFDRVGLAAGDSGIFGLPGRELRFPGHRCAASSDDRAAGVPGAGADRPLTIARSPLTPSGHRGPALQADLDARMPAVTGLASRSRPTGRVRKAGLAGRAISARSAPFPTHPQMSCHRRQACQRPVAGRQQWHYVTWDSGFPPLWRGPSVDIPA